MLRASTAHLEAGRFDEAALGLETLLASKLPHYRRLAHLQRAEIAARRGDRDEALAHIDGAVEGPIGRWYRARVRAVRLAGLSLRGFLRASAGDTAGAREDIAAVLGAPEAEPAQTARALLGEAMLLDRAGDRAGLRALLDRSRPLLLQSCPQRERALVRAYEAMLDAGGASGYRRQAERGAPADDRAGVADWVACYAPSAAPFVRASSREPAGGAAAEPPVVEEPSAEAQRLVAASRPSGLSWRTSLARTVWAVLWVVGAVGILLAWGELRGPDHPIRRAESFAIALALVAALIAWSGRGTPRTRAEARRLHAAGRAFARGDLESASQGFDFVPRAALHRTHAAHYQAEIALAKGDAGAALAACDRAFAAFAEAQNDGKVRRPAQGVGAAGADYPRILASQRALALAMLGRHDEAAAELAWSNGLLWEVLRLRVGVVKPLHEQDYAAATRMFEARDPAMWMAARDEVLGDLVRFVARPTARSEAEAARLRGELRRDALLTRWLAAMAPALEAAFDEAANEAGGAGEPATS